jgi:hypothetical protein
MFCRDRPLSPKFIQWKRLIHANISFGGTRGQEGGGEDQFGDERIIYKWILEDGHII